MKINRNLLRSELFFSVLAELGVKDVFISPGSRSTPLTAAAAKNEKLRKHVIVDERSAAFFALGAAKASGIPAVLICTSGTAATEYYPAITEAWKQRTPLLVCTADRPPELRNRGANQTINQVNLYQNHIRKYFDAGLPDVTTASMKQIVNIASEALRIAVETDRGPVHINFPFRKPLEPSLPTDEISVEQEAKYRAFKPAVRRIELPANALRQQVKKIAQRIHGGERAWIMAGPMERDDEFITSCISLADAAGLPVFADGASNLRFAGSINASVLRHHDALFRSGAFTAKYKPDFILHFGRTMTSKAVERWSEKHAVELIIVNEHGDYFDPSGRAAMPVTASPAAFCSELHQALSDYKPDRKWLEGMLAADKTAEELFLKRIAKAQFPHETRIPVLAVGSIPANSLLMLSNSIPVRDFDYFARQRSSPVRVLSNRGASGIDGILATAGGAALAAGEPAYVITGDLAFLHDVSSLHNLASLKLAVTIILINNSGGGIFNFLPVANETDIFEEYFLTPQQLDTAAVTKAFGGRHMLIDSWKELRDALRKPAKGVRVLEIRTDATASHKKRSRFWQETASKLDTLLTD